jgi:DNA-binding CsgD family transcriptional regulator/PAS domain-containing protein
MSLRAAGCKCPSDRRGGALSSMMTTDQAEQLSELISEIYDAALDPSRWSEVVDKAGRFVGGSAAAIVLANAGAGNDNVYCESGTAPYDRQRYCDKYLVPEPSTNGDTFADIERLIAIADLMPYRECPEAPSYRGRGRPQGPVDVVSAVLDKSLAGAPLFGVPGSGSDDVVDDETRQRMRLIVPHIRRAVLIGKDIDLKSAQAATLADTLDGLSAGICLVDATGRILHANAACQALLDAGDFLSATEGRIAASDVKVDQAFRDLFAAAGGEGAAVEARGTALALRRRDGSHYVAHVVPLTSGTRRLAGIAYSAAAAVFICKVATESLASPDVIARTYNLTPSELRVLLGIVEIGGVPEVATALGVAESTVKTHLGRLFLKTGAGRQADLVKIVAGFATPLTA